MPRLEDAETYALLLQLAKEARFLWKKVALDELRGFDGPSHLGVQQAIVDHLLTGLKVSEVAQHEPYAGTVGYEFRLTVDDIRLFVKVVLLDAPASLQVVSCHRGWRT